MVLTLMEATAVPQLFWILVAEWMNLFGDHIEFLSWWPSGIWEPHPECIDIYIYREGAYICILISFLPSAYFLEDFIFLSFCSVCLATVRGRHIQKPKARERQSDHPVFRWFFLLEMCFLSQGEKNTHKKVFALLLLLLMSVITNNLFICQFREADSGFRRKRSKATSSLGFETTRPHGCNHAKSRAPCTPAYKARGGARKGTRGRMSRSWHHHPFTVPVPNVQVLIGTVRFSFFFLPLLHQRKLISKKYWSG